MVDGRLMMITFPMYNVALLFKQHLTDKIPPSSSSSFFFAINQQNSIINREEREKRHFKDKCLPFFSLERDIHHTGNTTNGSDGCGSNEKLNINGTNSSHSSASGKKKKCKRRHR